MSFLRVQEFAKAQDLNISQLQRKANITMTAARRYWYGTREGKENGTPLKEIDLDVLQSIARVLNVSKRDLLGED